MKTYSMKTIYCILLEYIHMFVCVFVCLFVCVFVCLFVCLFVCVCLCTYMCVHGCSNKIFIHSGHWALESLKTLESPRIPLEFD